MPAEAVLSANVAAAFPRLRCRVHGRNGRGGRLSSVGADLEPELPRATCAVSPTAARDSTGPSSSAVVEAKQPAESLAANNRSIVAQNGWLGAQELVVEPLVRTLAVVVGDELCQ